jgi:hypothetical protein
MKHLPLAWTNGTLIVTRVEVEARLSHMPTP